MDDYRNSPTIKFCADLFPSHGCPSAIKFKIRLEWASVNWSNLFLISKAYHNYGLTFRQIKWTECKNWKRNSEKFNFQLSLFLWFRINYSGAWNVLIKLCKSNWNCAWNLAFPVFISPIVWNMCENLRLLWIGIFQRATQRPRILLTDNILSGGSCSVNYY